MRKIEKRLIALAVVTAGTLVMPQPAHAVAMNFCVTIDGRSYCVTTDETTVSAKAPLVAPAFGEDTTPGGLATRLYGYDGQNNPRALYCSNHPEALACGGRGTARTPDTIPLNPAIIAPSPGRVATPYLANLYPQRNAQSCVGGSGPYFGPYPASAQVRESGDLILTALTLAGLSLIGPEGAATGGGIYIFGRVSGMIGSGGKAPEFYGPTVTESEFVDSALFYLGEPYETFPGGRYISANRMWQVRFGAHETSGRAPMHAHFESLEGGEVAEDMVVRIVPDVCK